MKLALFLSLSWMVWLTACGGDVPHTRAAPAADALPVQAGAAVSGDWAEVYEATGTVRARTAAVISSRIMAYVAQVPVQVGDRVREGQVLVTLDARDLDANVRRAQAALSEVRSAIPEADNGVAAAKANRDLAESTFGRMEELAATKSISNQEFDEASARRKASQANFDMARAKRTQFDSKLLQVEEEIRAATILRDYTRIAAPFAGVVTAKSVEPGNLAAPGTPLLTVEREGAFRLEASIDESRLPLMKPGQAVEVTLEALDRKVNARVAEIVPAVDATSRTYMVKIDLPALANVRSGMFGRARFSLAPRKVVTIRAGALVDRGQLQTVFAIEDGTARMRLVTTGRRHDNHVEVLSGLTEGERIVSPVPVGLTDGARVEVRQ